MWPSNYCADNSLIKWWHLVCDFPKANGAKHSYSYSNLRTDSGKHGGDLRQPGIVQRTDNSIRVYETDPKFVRRALATAQLWKQPENSQMTAISNRSNPSSNPGHGFIQQAVLPLWL